ncbi:MAG: hypothetical protein DRP11_01510, partial [Candidatus Aenigmatarchaeota archaeon]
HDLSQLFSLFFLQVDKAHILTSLLELPFSIPPPDSFGQILSQLAPTAAALTGAAGLAAQDFARAVVDISANMEIWQQQLETVMGSAQEARETLEWLAEFAAETPFEIPGLVQATVTLEAYGQSARKWLPLVGEWAAAMSIDISDAARAVARALSGSAEGFEILRNYGINTAKLLAAGWSGAYQDIESTARALERVFMEFAGGMEKQARTYRGIMSNLSDAFSRFALLLGERFFEDLKGRMRELLVVFNEMFQTGEMDRWADRLGAVFRAAVDFFGGATQAAIGFARAIDKIMGKLERLFGISHVDAMAAEVRGLQEQIEHYEELVEKYEEYEEKAREAGQTIAEFAAHNDEVRRTIDELAQRFPDAVVAVDSFGRAVGISVTKVRELISEMRALNQVAARETAREIFKSVAELEKRRAALLEEERKIREALKAGKAYQPSPKAGRAYGLMGPMPVVGAERQREVWRQVTEELAEVNTRLAHMRSLLPDVLKAMGPEAVKTAKGIVALQRQWESMDEAARKSEKGAKTLAQLRGQARGLAEVLGIGAKNADVLLKLLPDVVAQLDKGRKVTEDQGKKVRQLTKEELEWRKKSIQKYVEFVNKQIQLGRMSTREGIVQLQKLYNDERLTNEERERISEALAQLRERLAIETAKAEAEAARKAEEEQKRLLQERRAREEEWRRESLANYVSWVREQVAEDKMSTEEAIRRLNKLLSREELVKEERERIYQTVAELRKRAAQAGKEEVEVAEEAVESLEIRIEALGGAETVYRRMILHAETAEERFRALVRAGTNIRQELVRLGLVDPFEASRAAAQELISLTQLGLEGTEEWLRVMEELGGTTEEKLKELSELLEKVKNGELEVKKAVELLAGKHREAGEVAQQSSRKMKRATLDVWAIAREAANAVGMLIEEWDAFGEASEVAGEVAYDGIQIVVSALMGDYTNAVVHVIDLVAQLAKEWAGVAEEANKAIESMRGSIEDNLAGVFVDALFEGASVEEVREKAKRMFAETILEEFARSLLQAGVIKQVLDTFWRVYEQVTSEHSAGGEMIVPSELEQLGRAMNQATTAIDQAWSVFEQVATPWLEKYGIPTGEGGLGGAEEYGTGSSIRTITRTQAENISLLLKSSESILRQIEQNTAGILDYTREIALHTSVLPALAGVGSGGRDVNEQLAREYRIRKRALGG